MKAKHHLGVNRVSSGLASGVLLLAGLAFTSPKPGKLTARAEPEAFGKHGALMFLAGGSLGPALDGVAHGNFGVRASQVLRGRASEWMPAACSLLEASHGGRNGLERHDAWT